MYTGKHAILRPLQPAFIMASSGEAVTYRELDARSNRLADLRVLIPELLNILPTATAGEATWIGL